MSPTELEATLEQTDKIVIAVERKGGGGAVIEFIRKDKIRNLLQDEGSLGALLRDLVAQDRS